MQKSTKIGHKIMTLYKDLKVTQKSTKIGRKIMTLYWDLKVMLKSTDFDAT